MQKDSPAKLMYPVLNVELRQAWGGAERCACGLNSRHTPYWKQLGKLVPKLLNSQTTSEVEEHVAKARASCSRSTSGSSLEMTVTVEPRGVKRRMLFTRSAIDPSCQHTCRHPTRCETLLTSCFAPAGEVSARSEVRRG